MMCTVWYSCEGWFITDCEGLTYAMPVQCAVVHEVDKTFQWNYAFL